MTKFLTSLGLSLVLLSVVTLGQPAKARAGGTLEYTWTLAALGQGGWIGGPLFSDGTTGGGGALVIKNGQIVASFQPTTWSENASEQITVCFNMVELKGPPNALPPSSCFGPAPVTGTATKIMFMGEPHIFRITELH